MKKFTKKLFKLGFFYAAISGPLASALTATLTAEDGKARVNGYAQTPKGGSAETTSFRRPSFAELGIKRNSLYHFAINLQHNDYFFNLDYLHLNPHGSDSLSQDLLTHSQFIPTKSEFGLNVEYDWYRFALGKNFYFSDKKWRIAPALLAEWLKYHYSFTAPPLGSSRSFTLLASSFGLQIHREFDKKFSGDIAATYTLPLSNLKLSTLSFALNYALVITPRLFIIPRITLGWLTIDYEDEQLVPNHIHYTATPYGTIGLNLTIK